MSNFTPSVFSVKSVSNGLINGLKRFFYGKMLELEPFFWNFAFIVLHLLKIKEQCPQHSQSLAQK